MHLVALTHPIINSCPSFLANIALGSLTLPGQVATRPKTWLCPWSLLYVDISQMRLRFQWLYNDPLPPVDVPLFWCLNWSHASGPWGTFHQGPSGVWTLGPSLTKTGVWADLVAMEWRAVTKFHLLEGLSNPQKPPGSINKDLDKWFYHMIRHYSYVNPPSKRENKWVVFFYHPSQPL